MSGKDFAIVFGAGFIVGSSLFGWPIGAHMTQHYIARPLVTGTNSKHVKRSFSNENIHYSRYPQLGPLL
jgi:hypothetical protein